jgi:hypothetical protein
MTALLATAAALTSCSVSVANVVQKNAPGPRIRVTAYLTAIKHQDLKAAYQSLCPGESESHFVGRVNTTRSKAGLLRDWTITASNRLSNGDAVVTFSATTENGQDDRSVTLLSRAHDWCISSIE